MIFSDFQALFSSNKVNPCNQQGFVLMAVRLPRLGHDMYWSFCLGLRFDHSGEASCHTMESFKQPEERLAWQGTEVPPPAGANLPVP